VSAHSNVGETLVRRGTFRSVTAARCHWLKHAVQVAREHDERQAREGEREGEREERERLKRWESNCRALGDTPAVLNEEGGVLHVCRTPGGYTIEVPE
jgi:Cu2+-containing amine oxidase